MDQPNRGGNNNEEKRIVFIVSLLFFIVDSIEYIVGILISRNFSIVFLSVTSFIIASYYIIMQLYRNGASKITLVNRYSFKWPKKSVPCGASIFVSAPSLKLDHNDHE